MSDLFKAPNGRNLTPKQTAKLDRLPNLEPTAIVTGWSETYSGPIIQADDKPERAVAQNGFLRIMRASDK